MYFSYYFLIRDDFLSWVGTWDLTIGGWGWDWPWGGLPLLFGSGPRGDGGADDNLAEYEAVAFELEAVAVATKNSSQKNSIIESLNIITNKNKIKLD